MRKTIKRFGFAAIILFSLLLLLYKADSTFGTYFWCAFYIFWIALIAMLLSWALFLYKRRRFSAIIIGGIIGLVGILIGVTVIILTLDYRIMLPLTTGNVLKSEHVEDDLSYLVSAFRDHPGFDDHMDSLSTPIIANLRRDLVSKNRNKWLHGVSSLVGLYKDGHSFVPPFQVYNRSRYYPLLGHDFADGFYILKTADEHDLTRS